MKIVVTGTRGIPDIQGGVETHCEQLFPRIAAAGHDVTVIRRKSYVTAPADSFKGVSLIDIPAPRKKSFEALIHTVRAIIKAKRLHADILHIHAVGPALAVPLARLLGMKTVMTNHGPDYDREKWSPLAKQVLRLGERLGTHFANAEIVISPLIQSNIARMYGRKDTDLIFNGVERPKKTADTDYTASLGLEPGKYVVALGRFVKEKNFHLLIRAFSHIDPDGIKLVLAGDADMDDDYSQKLKQQARDNGVILTGFIKGRKLCEIMSHARLFVLPSTHEGLPISLLEAMSYGLDVLVSDIPANKLPELHSTDFFKAADEQSLESALTRKLAHPAGDRIYDLRNYDWDEIARKTISVYNRVTGRK